MRETDQRRAPHYGKRLLHFFRHESDPLRIKTILGLTLTPAMVACALCVGCSTQPDNVLSIPSPANEQAPPPEVVAADTEANGTFIATSLSTQGLWKMKSGIINGTGFPSSLANSTLRVCYDLAGADFPSAFESTAENGYFYTVYTRQP